MSGSNIRWNIILKIAVAFFGIPRNSTLCFPSIQANILGALPAAAEVSCYYHLYRLQEIVNPRSGEQGMLSEDNFEPFHGMQGIIEEPELCLERWNFEAIRQRGDTWRDDFRSVRNLIHQLNSLHRVTELLAPSAPDFVVYVRPDILYHDPLPGYVFAKPEMRRRNVYIPNWQWWGGLNDRFAICGKESFWAYGCRIEDMLAFCDSSGRPVHSERLLKFALQRHGARVCLMDTTASRVRIDGKFADEPFSSKRSMGKRENRVFHRLARLRTFIDRRL